MRTIGASRHGMFRRLFSVLSCLLLLICCARGPAHADSAAQGGTVGLFLPGKTRVPERPGDENSVKDVKLFHSPFFLSADGVMVAFAGADYTESGKRNVNIVARYITTAGEDWAARVTDGSGDKWKTQLVLQKEENKIYYYWLGGLVSVVKNNKVYLLAVVWAKRTSKWYLFSSGDWEFVLAVGEIKGLANGGHIIRWQTAEFSLANLTQEFKDRSWSVLESDLSAFLTKEEQIVFVVGARDGAGKCGSAIIQLEDSGKKWEVVYDEIAKGCTLSRYFEWEGKLTRVTMCSGDSIKVEESADMGKAWTDAGERFSGVWNTLDGTGSFAITTLEGKNVLLYTQTTSETIGRWEKTTTCDVDLYLTDGERVHPAGKILHTDKHIISGGLQYTDGELFFLYNQQDRPTGIRLMRLESQLHDMKSEVRKWTEEDQGLEGQTNPSNLTTPKRSCANALQTAVPEKNAPQIAVSEKNAPQTAVPEKNAPQTALPEKNALHPAAPQKNASQTAKPSDRSVHLCVETVLAFLLGFWVVAVFW